MAARELILAFESSCDETSVAVVENGTKILSNIIATQIKSHQRFGGVVPEVASRHHVEQITLVTDAALKEAGVTYTDLTAVAVTYGPGLVGALLIGVTAAKTIAYAHHLPLIPVNHMAGHIYAARFVKPLVYPLLALAVSGGHTELVYMRAAGEFEIIGDTRDDAAGEAFDKTAKLLGLDYPGGPMLSKMAAQGTAGRFVFPRPMTDRPGLDFSFSGLKTFAANTIRSNGDDEPTRADIARAFEDAVVDTLMIKCKRALDQTGGKRLVMAGGVSANRTLRAKLAEMMKKRRGEVFYARPEFCTDNGAMIAYAGMVRFKAGATADLGVSVRPRWPLAELPAA